MSDPIAEPLPPSSMPPHAHPATPPGAGGGPTAPGPVRLADVARRVGGAVVPGGIPDIVLTDVTHDSTRAGPGVLFGARPGARADGHDFVPQAVAAGSPAVLVERVLASGVPEVVVGSVAEALGPAAACVHGDPTTDLDLVGVTGTNGKTTTVFLLEAGMAAAGRRTGLVGTVETRIGTETVPGVRTTPEASDLQRLFARMRAADVDAVAMEVSSHGLALGRVRGSRFRAVGFANLTHDHLDFHGSIEAYHRAKASLFTDAYAPVGVVNVDDPAGRRIVAESTIPVVGVSTAPAVPDLDAAARSRLEGLVRATDVDLRADGSTFVLRSGGRRVRVDVRLPGAFNVANATLALTLLEIAGVDVEAAAAGISRLGAVPGRMERVDAGQPFAVVVDYAHTPDALERVLDAARTVTRGRLTVVIGCGGDRDRDKRPVMGRVAARGADRAVLTNDNPRSEDPDAILDAMEVGATEAAGAQVDRIPDRRAAITAAVGRAEPGDIVVIAGKGHERTQELADGTVAFDDRVVARAALAALGWDPEDRG